MLSILGLTVAASACKDAVPDAVTDPVVVPDSVVVASIEMLPSERVLSFIGMSDRLSARRILADGSLNGGARLNPHLYTWSSDAPDVVTVDSLGVVTAIRTGTARITAMSSGRAGTAIVTVRDAVRLAWSAPTALAPGALTIGDDGTIYVPTVDTVHALAPSGQRRWSVRTGGQVVSAPAIAPNGTIYVGTFGPFGSSGSLIAIDRSGTVRWTLENIGAIASSPAIGSDGIIYAASLNSTLYAIDPAGQKRWEFRAQGSFLRSSPAIGQDGAIMIGATDGRLYAVRPDGTERWTYQTGDSIASSPAIARDGTIYFTSEAQQLYALTPEGSLKWSLPLPLGSQALWSPAIGFDGTVYVGGDGLHAVDATGRLRWTYLGTNPRSGTQGLVTPVVAGDGTIYVGGGIGFAHVFALAPDGTLKWDYPTSGPIFGVPAIGLDGTIFSASAATSTTLAGTLYAIVERAGSNGGFANAPWPKHRGDRANTGRGGGR